MQAVVLFDCSLGRRSRPRPNNVVRYPWALVVLLLPLDHLVRDRLLLRLDIERVPQRGTNQIRTYGIGCGTRRFLRSDTETLTQPCRVKLDVGSPFLSFAPFSSCSAFFTQVLSW